MCIRDRGRIVLFLRSNVKENSVKMPYNAGIQI